LKGDFCYWCKFQEVALSKAEHANPSTSTRRQGGGRGGGNKKYCTFGTFALRKRNTQEDVVKITERLVVVVVQLLFCGFTVVKLGF